jgi:hypothetical protein
MSISDKRTTLSFQEGNRLCRVDLAWIADVVGVEVDCLRHTLLRLASDGEQAVDEQREEVARFKRTIQETKNVNSETLQGGGVGEDLSDEEFVHRLASHLGDGANIGWLRKLAAMHPRSLLQDALERAMAVPAHQIRKSRGAYFTGIVRILTGTHARNRLGPGDGGGTQQAQTH